MATIDQVLLFTQGLGTTRGDVEARIRESIVTDIHAVVGAESNTCLRKIVGAPRGEASLSGGGFI